MTSTDWPVTIDPQILDYRESRLSAAMLRVLLYLDSVARMDTYAVVSHGDISLATGLSHKSLTRALEDCEAAGWIMRAYLGPKRRVWTAIILTRRIGPGTPAADTPGLVKEARAALMGR